MKRKFDEMKVLKFQFCEVEAPHYSQSTLFTYLHFSFLQPASTGLYCLLIWNSNHETLKSKKDICHHHHITKPPPPPPNIPFALGTTYQIKRHVSILWDEQPSICFSSLLKFRYSNKQRDSNLCSTKLRPAPQPAKPAQREYQISFLLFIIVSQTDSQADSKKNNRARANH